jgi:ribonuclease HI
MKTPDLTAGIDYYLYTDGSGHTDKIGGSCAVVFNCATQEEKIIVSGRNYTTVPRQEFFALLLGLEYIQSTNSFSGQTIHWYSDCESLVQSVNREYSRSSNKDLWHLFDFYERDYEIIAEHIEREDERMIEADTHASSMRQILKEYLYAITE